MANYESTATFRANIAQLKKEMQSASRAVRLADSEFKKATAGMDNWSSSADGLQAKLTQLGRKTDALKKQEEQQKKILEETIRAYGKESAAAEREETALNKIQAALKQTESEQKKYEDALKETESASDKLNDAISEQESKLEEAKRAYKDALLDDNKESAERYAQEIKELSTELRDNKQRMEQADKAADQLDRSMDDVGDSAERAGDGFTVMKGVLSDVIGDVLRRAIDGFKELAKQTFEAGSNFESAMSEVEAISGANGSEMEQLTAKAKEMGETTKFSATESADAFKYMAMAGWDTEDMLNGISGLMSLAAASGEDLGTTSDIVTDALTAMGYSAGDAGKLADVMAAASSNANTNVGLMGATFQYAAPLVGALGYNMEDTAVAIGLMANAGIKGQKAGTALRSILSRLSAPPKECASEMEELGISLTDSEGNMKSLSEVMGDLRGAFSKLSDTEKAGAAKHIAGQEAMSGLLAIVDAAPADFDKLTEAVNNSTGAALTMSETMNDNVGGQITLLKSKIEGIMIKVFEKMSGSIRKAIDTISKALDGVDWDKFAENAGGVAEKVAEFFAYVINHGSEIVNVLKTIAIAFVTYKAVSIISNVTSAFGTLFSAIQGGEGIMTAFSSALKMNPVGLLAAGIGAAVTAIISYTQGLEDALEAQYGLNDEQQAAIDKANEVADAYQTTNSAREEATKKATAEFDYIKQLKDEYNTLIDSNGQVKDGYQDRANFIINQLAEAMGVERSEIQKNIDKNGEMGKSIDELIQKKQAEITLQANESAYTEAITKQSEALEAYMQATDASEQADRRFIEARGEVNAVMQEYNRMLQNGNSNAEEYLAQNQNVIDGLEVARQAQDEAKKAVERSESAYVGYSSTIRNYESLSQAIISGSQTKIRTALENIQTNFVTAKDGTKATLTQQVTDLDNTYLAMQQAVNKGMGGVTTEQVNAAKNMRDRAQEELEKFEANATKSGQDAGTNYAKGLNSKSSNAQKSGQNVGKAGVKGETSGSSGSKKAGQTAGSNYSGGLASKKKDASSSGRTLGTEAVSGANKGAAGMKSTGQTGGKEFTGGVSSKNGEAKTAGKNLADNAKTGASGVDTTGVGENFGQGFINGIGNKIAGAIRAAGNLVRKSLNEADRVARDGSPSKEMRQRGRWFSEGYSIGIADKTPDAVHAAGGMVNDAINAVNTTQDSHSPSKVTEKSGRDFVKGYICVITKPETALVSTVKNVIGNVVTAAKNVSGNGFALAGQNAATIFSDAFSKKSDYVIARMQYENDSMISDFDTTIKSLNNQKTKAANKLQADSDKAVKKIKKAQENNKKLAALEKKYNKAESGSKEKKKLKKQIAEIKEKYTKQINAEKASTKKAIDASNKSYDDQVKAQEKSKAAYQTASQQMIGEFSRAMSEYQTKAENLINDTLNGITENYTARYDELIGKQDNLIQKLKDAGNLFDISGAGVMTVNDLKAQTAAITDYTDKLQKIKGKVSAELFDQIASYDMAEGSAFLDRLLAMSASDLDAYNKAYTEKMQAAQKAGDTIYKADFAKLKTDYESEIDKAFKNLPAQLEALGTQSMKGFLNGLSGNTDYMAKNVKTFVSAIIAEFKKDLGIKSPSRVMFGIGEFTGKGFDLGLMSMIKEIQNTAGQIVSGVTSPFDGIGANLGAIRSGLNAGAYGSGSVVNNYNLVQNNSSPKPLTALETYQARRQQIEMIKAMA